MIRLHDTATGTVRALELREPNKVAMYVCGPTVYGPPHIGHGRFNLVFDVLRRYLRWSGYEVTYVSNITDIDDKIIARAAEEDRPWTDVADEFEGVWWQTMDLLGIERPDRTPHATEYVPHMVDLIQRLIDDGSAYETSDGVYFRSAVVPDYGLLARQSLESLRSGARVAVSDEKESSVDFALWKKVKPGEPSWPAPWGDGRPGWHTECVVMSLDLLGEQFDIHGGGQDLAFPHHENERAQACADHRVFANHWVHNGFVMVDGEKMSKSLGNVTNLPELLQTHDPRAYRMIALQAHYRSPLEVTDTTLANATATLSRLDNAARRLADARLGGAEPDSSYVDAFRERMDDDLDTPGAMTKIFAAVSELNRLLDMDDGASAAGVGAALLTMLDGVGLTVVSQESAVPKEILSLAADRDEARARRDWTRADQLRDELASKGWAIEDGPSGTRVRPA